MASLPESYGVEVAAGPGCAAEVATEVVVVGGLIGSSASVPADAVPAAAASPAFDVGISADNLLVALPNHEVGHALGFLRTVYPGSIPGVASTCKSHQCRLRTPSEMSVAATLDAAATRIARNSAQFAVG